MKADEEIYDVITDTDESRNVSKGNFWKEKGKGYTENKNYRIRILEPQDRYPQYCIIETSYIDKSGVKRLKRRMYKKR